MESDVADALHKLICNYHKNSKYWVRGDQDQTDPQE